jgi:outer membrane protease
MPTQNTGKILSFGKCGENLTWTLDDAGTLTISGTGKMTNYEWANAGTSPFA